MKITRAMLLAAVPTLYKDRLDGFVETFNQYAETFGITSRLRVVHYLAQVFHESGALRYVEEIASGQQYEGRKDLGNTQPGDGRRFKGRGFIQITGRQNYQAYAKSAFCKGDLMSHPEWLAQLPGAQKASMWFWWRNGLNGLADRDDVRSVTRRVNGGLNGLSQREYYLRRFKRIIP